MKQVRAYSDERLDDMCSYCGQRPGTRDHVPSKVLLDEPFPENLPVVPCCDSCNQGFSRDEEYIACLLECVLNGTTDVDKLKRPKIKRLLTDKPFLQKRIQDAITHVNGEILFNVETERLKNVLIKLAKGHAKFENSQPIINPPTFYNCVPLSTMPQDEINLFLSSTNIEKSPEVGSRSMQHFIIDSYNNVYNPWIEVQHNRYSYCVSAGLGILSVKIIIANYLVAEIIWQE